MPTGKGEVQDAITVLQADMARGLWMAPRPGTIQETRMASFVASLASVAALAAAVPQGGRSRAEALAVADAATATLV